MNGSGPSAALGRRLLQVRAPWIMLVTGAVLAGTWVLAAGQVPEYVSVSAVNVQTRVLPNTTPVTPNMATERQLVASGVVVNKVTVALGMTDDALAKAMSVTVPADTTLLDISCRAVTPAAARRCAAALAQAYVEYRNTAGAGAAPAGATSAGTTAKPGGAKAPAVPEDPVRAVLVSPATLPETAAGTSKPMLLAIGLVLGLALGVGTAFARDRLDDRVRNQADVERRFGGPVVASLPRITGRSAPAHVVSSAPDSPGAQAFRYLRVRLDSWWWGAASGPDLLTAMPAVVPAVVPAAVPAAVPSAVPDAGDRRRGRVVLVTGGRAGEGSTTVASNLAASFALTGRRTLLVDGDVSGVVGLDLLYGFGEQPGLVDVLAGSHRPEEVVQASSPEQLSIVTAGFGGNRRPELLEIARLRTTLDRLAGMAEVVVLDGPPVLGGGDALTLAVVSDLVVVVFDGRRATRTHVEAVAAELRGVGRAQAFGVLNRARRSAQGTPRRPAAQPVPRSAAPLPSTWQPAVGRLPGEDATPTVRHAARGQTAGAGGMAATPSDGLPALARFTTAADGWPYTEMPDSGPHTAPGSAPNTAPQNGR